MIKKFRLFELKGHDDIDPYGEEIWDDIMGFEIKKMPLVKGGYYYFASFHDQEPVNQPGGFFQFQGVMPNNYLLAIGDMFNNGYSFRFYPMPDWDFVELTEEEKDDFFSDKLKVKVFHLVAKEGNFRRGEEENEGEMKDLTFSEILKIFNITKDEFIMAKNQ
jgi:hypothetical protein